jgi:hypothetical protein
MSHTDDPRDSCGGQRRCGSNLLVSSAAPAKSESRVKRNVRAVRDVVSSMRSSIALRSAR